MEPPGITAKMQHNRPVHRNVVEDLGLPPRRSQLGELGSPRAIADLQRNRTSELPAHLSSASRCCWGEVAMLPRLRRALGRVDPSD